MYDVGTPDDSGIGMWETRLATSCNPEPPALRSLAVRKSAATANSGRVARRAAKATAEDR